MQPTFKSQAERLWRSGWIGAGAAGLLGLLLLHPGLPWLRLLSYDLLSLATPAARPQEAVIVYMDEESYVKLEQPVHGLWDRRLHAQLLRQLLKADVQAVAFDILFDRPMPDQDPVFASALREAGDRVVVASVLDQTAVGPGHVARPLLPSASLGTNVASGIVNHAPETFGIIRRQISFPHPSHTSFAMKLAQVSGGLVREPPETAWLRYYGDTGIPAIPYHAVISNGVPAQTLAGKVVFVGRGNLITAEGPLQTDFHRTPSFWVKGRAMAGVELQATAFLNLHRHEWWSALPSIAEAFLVAGLGLLVGRWFAVEGLRRSVVRSMLAVAVVAAGSLVFAWAGHYWCSWLVPAAVQVPCALVFAGVAPRRRRLDAFLSYRRKDAGHALWLQSQLALHRLRLYVDLTELTPGDNFRPELKDAIREAPVFIVLISEGSLDRCWVEDDVMTQEIVHADERGKRIIPLLLPGFTWAQLPFAQPPASLADHLNRRARLPRAVLQLSEREGVEHFDKSGENTITRLLRVMERRD